MNKTILITGGSGFIGKNIVLKLLQMEYKIVLLSKKKILLSSFNNKNIYNELYDMNNLDFSTIFEKYKISIILHMASQTNKNCSYIDAIDSNMRFPLALISIALEYKVKYFINTDTTFYHIEKNTYSLSKKQFREWLKLKEKETTVINLKIDNVYGEEDNKVRFIPMVISSLLDTVKNLKLTNGEQTRDFIYIDDFINLIYKIIETIDSFNIGFYEYDVGCGKPISIHDLVIEIKNLVGNNQTILNFGAIEYNKKDMIGLVSKIDISNTIKDFQWKPTTSLKDGLIKVIAYHQKRTNDE